MNRACLECGTADGRALLHAHNRMPFRPRIPGCVPLAFPNLFAVQTASPETVRFDSKKCDAEKWAGDSVHDQEPT